jgi:uncharacterized protein (TIGR00304 family)
MKSSRLLSMGLVLIFVGFFVVFLGALTSAGAGGPASSGGFILIGPIPIVFGNGPDSGLLAQVGLAITLVMVAIYLASFFFSRPEKRSKTGIRTESE